MITVHYELNNKCNGVEIYFSSKPEEKILLELKEKRWRWYAKKECWYNYQSVENILEAIKVCSAFYNNMNKVKENDYYQNSNIDSKFDPTEWELESILFVEGYTVSQKEGLGARQRQMILSKVIENYLMTPQKVVQHITAQIRLRENNSSYNLACSKWEEDIDFVKRKYF